MYPKFESFKQMNKLKNSLLNSEICLRGENLGKRKGSNVCQGEFSQTSNMTTF